MSKIEVIVWITVNWKGKGEKSNGEGEKSKKSLKRQLKMSKYS